MIIKVDFFNFVKLKQGTLRERPENSVINEVLYFTSIQRRMSRVRTQHGYLPNENLRNLFIFYIKYCADLTILTTSGALFR